MKFKYEKLKTKVESSIGYAKFAEELGLSEEALMDRLTKQEQFTMKEIIAGIFALNLPSVLADEYFFDVE